ncbi:MAG: stage V sporulation protein AA [Lachnospiraceae bacterium]|nr:stage V sporulation protein AA [Lachnospiraceae bacterium]
MSIEVYIKIDKHIITNKKNVLLSDIAGIHCVKKDIAKAIGKIQVLCIKSDENGIYAMTFIKIVELIHRYNQELTVINEGVSDFIIEYKPSQDVSVTRGAKPKKIKLEYVKAAFVAAVSFFGAAFTIMTFNIDVSVADIFDDIYKCVMGVDKNGETTILELAYCVGLPIGITVFFNHFSRKKLTTDPTPIHVEMRNYENEIDDALIEDASREGKTIDVS